MAQGRIFRQAVSLSKPGTDRAPGYRSSGRLRLQPDSGAKPLTVGIISTGDELVDVDMTAAYGQIRDVNSHVLAAMVKEMGCGVKSLRHCKGQL